MKNIITATIEFSFKGERLSPSLTLELGVYLKSTGSMPDLYMLIAKENNFDLYSYEYEMMQAEAIQFSNPDGLIENFINAGVLDVENFEAAWQEQHALSKLLEIAEDHLNITDFGQQSELKQALLAAYQLGKLDAK